MVSPEILMVENYQTIGHLGLVDALTGIALPYLGSAFGIFLLRQAFRTVPQDLDDAAKLAGLGVFRRIWHLYVPLRPGRPILPTAWCWSASTGTNSSGRWW